MLMKIGVIGFQGAVTEHIKTTEQAIENLGLTGEVIWLKNESQLSEVDSLIIPGGESTTIGRLISNAEMFEKIQEMGERGVPILGTCAGLILLAKEGGEEMKRTKQPLLKLMDMKVIRNAFGRQRESFETKLDIPILGGKPFPGIFIRAPAIEKTWGNAKPLAKFRGKIVAAKQKNLLAVAFHPELTLDTRVHEYYLKKVEEHSP